MCSHNTYDDFISAVVFIKEKKLFSSAPKEALDLVIDRKEEEFYGARKIGWTLMIMSFLIIGLVGVVSIWDGFRNEYTFWQFVLRFILIFTIYKIYDMTFFDYFM